MEASPTAVAIFAKAPIAGLAKTRLIPSLGADGAAKVQSLLIERAVICAKSANLGAVSLWCMPDCSHSFFEEIAEKHSVALHAQTGENLGARMENAFSLLKDSMPVLLMGTDCVAMEAKLLKRCAESLWEGHDAVFLPVEDGGYILIGLRRPVPVLFRDIPWATSRVMSETRKRTEELGLRTEEPAVLWDIDNPEDYARARSSGAL